MPLKKMLAKCVNFIAAYPKLTFLAGALMLSQNLSAVSLWDTDPHTVREQINQRVMSIQGKTMDVWSVRDDLVKHNGRTTPIRIYTPNDSEKLPLILFIHGGAWVAGSLDTHDNMARYFCHKAKAVVVSIGYQNSPEGKFPLPLEQCMDTLLWTIEHAGELHADPSRLAVSGDSAGGNMAAGLCLLVRDRKGPAISIQVLINPATDLSGGGTILKQNDSLDTPRWYATQYVSDPKDANSPYVSPLLANDLTGLPETLVILAEKDELRETGQRYADRLRSSGVRTNVYIQWGVDHLGGNGARVHQCAQESLDIAVAALRGAFRCRINQ
jgi:acetyl esterase